MKEQRKYINVETRNQTNQMIRGLDNEKQKNSCYTVSNCPFTYTCGVCWRTFPHVHISEYFPTRENMASREHILRKHATATMFSILHHPHIMWKKI